MELFSKSGIPDPKIFLVGFTQLSVMRETKRKLALQQK